MAGRVFELPDQVAVAVVSMVSVVAGSDVVSAQSVAAPAMAPSDGASPAVEDAGCFRPLSDVIWGFLVTLLACSVAFWGRYQHRQLGKREKIKAALVAIFIPIFDLHFYIWASFKNAMLIWKYQQSRQPLQSLSRRRQFQELWSPFSKFPGRILFRCDVVVYVEKGSPLLEVNWLWSLGRSVKVESAALVIGEVAVAKTKDEDYERKELSYKGILALLLAEVFPDYDELKFLRGNSGFAMIGIAIQALGYITAVVFRVVKDLPVAPLEVVGLILNIILLIDVSAYCFYNPCHRPLVIYTNSKRERKMLEALVTIKEPNIPWDRIYKVSNLIEPLVDLCLCGIVVYFIITLFQVSDIFVVLPLIFFAIATIILILDFIREYIFECPLTWDWSLVDWFIILLHMIVYTWTLVVTIVYWKPQHFNARAKLFNISQLIPFIG